MGRKRETRRKVVQKIDREKILNSEGMNNQAPTVIIIIQQTNTIILETNINIVKPIDLIIASYIIEMQSNRY